MPSLSASTYEFFVETRSQCLREASIQNANPGLFVTEIILCIGLLAGCLYSSFKGPDDYELSHNFIYFLNKKLWILYGILTYFFNSLTSLIITKIYIANFNIKLHNIILVLIYALINGGTIRGILFLGYYSWNYGVSDSTYTQPVIPSHFTKYFQSTYTTPYWAFLVSESGTEWNLLFMLIFIFNCSLYTRLCTTKSNYKEKQKHHVHHQQPSHSQLQVSITSDSTNGNNNTTNDATVATLTPQVDRNVIISENKMRLLVDSDSNYSLNAGSTKSLTPNDARVATDENEATNDAIARSVQNGDEVETSANRYPIAKNSDYDGNCGCKDYFAIICLSISLVLMMSISSIYFYLFGILDLNLWKKNRTTILYTYIMLFSVLKWIMRRICKKIDYHIMIFQQKYQEINGEAVKDKLMSIEIFVAEIWMSGYYWCFYRYFTIVWAGQYDMTYPQFFGIKGLHLLSEFFESWLKLTPTFYNLCKKHDQETANIFQRFLGRMVGNSTYEVWLSRFSIDISIRFVVSMIETLFIGIEVLEIYFSGELRLYFDISWTSTILKKQITFLILSVVIELIFFLAIRMYFIKTQNCDVFKQFYVVYYFSKSKIFFLVALCVSTFHFF